MTGEVVPLPGVAAVEAVLRPFLPYVPLLLTILGWYVANRAAATRETRKERRTEVDACCKMAAEILAKARTYYTKPASDTDAVKAGREIVFELHRLLQRIDRLERACPRFEVNGAWSDLHDAATGGDFEQSGRTARPHNDELIAQIEYTTHALIDCLEDGFSKTYP